MKDRTARRILIILLLATFAARAWRLDQPIVENYVGRQIPTAMVARNLDRGSGFLHPQLDTGPFPNLFLVEPPIYQELTLLTSRCSGLSLPESGRLVSALATMLSAWGLFGLVRRRERNMVSIVSVAIFSLAPITLRFGLAFQPDMLMLGLQLASLRLWDVEPNLGRIRFFLAWTSARCELDDQDYVGLRVDSFDFHGPCQKAFFTSAVLLSRSCPRFFGTSTLRGCSLSRRDRACDRQHGDLVPVSFGFLES